MQSLCYIWVLEALKEKDRIKNLKESFTEKEQKKSRVEAGQF